MRAGRTICLAAIAIAFGGAAHAAEGTRAGFIWDGFYIGIHGGYVSAENQIATFNANAAFKPSSEVLGAQFGFNRHIAPNWVLGYEIDISWTDLSASGAVPGFFGGRVDSNVFGTARTRLGYAQGPWLVYATGGLAWSTSTFALNPTLMNFDRAQVGYAAGAGIEYALSRSWSAKFEYLYAKLDGGYSTLAGNRANSDLTLNLARVGLNYRFANVQAPLAAIPVRSAARSSTWSGAYIGVHAGHGEGSFQSSRGLLFTDIDADSGLRGIQAGYNWQLAPNFLFGIETDSSWASLKGSNGPSFIKIDSLGSVRARLGVTSTQWLLYVTGGFGWAHADSSVFPGLVPIYDRYFIGWTAGVGLEYAFAPRWTAKIEYLHADYGTRADTFIGTTFNDSLTTGVVKFGLNYRASFFE